MNRDLKNKVKNKVCDALKMADARRESAIAEYRRLLERFLKLGPPRLAPDMRPRPTTDPFETKFAEMEDTKSKSGRPGIWRGLAGYWLVKTVEEIQEANGRYSLAQAIRKAVKTDSVLKNCKPLRRISDRALQARYQQAAEYWELARIDVFEKRLDRAREAADDAIRQVDSLRQLLRHFL